MPNIGPMELVVIVVLALLVFGPKKLPEIGRGVGQAMREFKRASRDLMDSFNDTLDERPRATVTDSYHPPPADSTYAYQPPMGTYAADSPDSHTPGSPEMGGGVTEPTPTGETPTVAPVTADPQPAPTATTVAGSELATAHAPERTT